MRRISARQSGSALLIAILMVGLVGTVGFGLTRISLLRSRLYTLSDASIAAYHAAESGLELALTQFSVDKNAGLSFEVIQGDTAPVVPEYRGAQTNPARNFTPVRYNLERDSTASGALAITSDEQQFDVLMWHHAYSIGEEACFSSEVATFEDCGSTEHPLGQLAPDATQTIFLPSVGSDLTVSLRARPVTPPISFSTNNEEAKRQGVLVIDSFIDDNQFWRQEVFILGDSGQYTQLANNGVGVDRYQIPNLRPSVNKLTLTYYGPQDGSDNPLLFALVATDAADSLVPVDSGLTIIDVVGHAGGSDRRLRATVDRTTNRVIDIFDYALYASTQLNVP